MKRSTLKERLFYSERVVSGEYTIKQVSEITKYSKVTIYNWVKLYKEYGSSYIINNACAFKHTGGVK
jgi:transposase